MNFNHHDDAETLGNDDAICWCKLNTCLYIMKFMSFLVLSLLPRMETIPVGAYVMDMAPKKLTVPQTLSLEPPGGRPTASKKTAPKATAKPKPIAKPTKPVVKVSVKVPPTRKSQGKKPTGGDLTQPTVKPMLQHPPVQPTMQPMLQPQVQPMMQPAMGQAVMGQAVMGQPMMGQPMMQTLGHPTQPMVQPMVQPIMGTGLSTQPMAQAMFGYPTQPMVQCSSL